MMYFGNRRPRGFHYTRRFGNERRDVLDSLRRGVPPDEVAARSLGDGSCGGARRPGRRHGLPLAWGLALLAALAAGAAAIGVCLLQASHINT